MKAVLETAEVDLYYTVRGSGPMLLILQGGAGNADGSEALVRELVDHFTVVTYDRRGLSWSKPVRVEQCEIGTHADDVARLVAALSSQPVFVFGSSMGAVIGIELAVRHPNMVNRLIAHEPPVYRLLEGSEREEALASHAQLLEIFKRDGLQAAMNLMIARSGVAFSDREPDVAAMAPPTDPTDAAQRAADLKHFWTWDAPSVTRYQPDLAALKIAAPKIIPGIGDSSPSTFAGRSTMALASLLGQEAAPFPGGHTSYILRPKATAAKIHELLR